MSLLNRSHPSRRAFTIVEMLVVIGIMAVLLGLLLPAIGRARATSRKTEELSNIREVFRAWTLYGNTNDDAALPGYLSPQTQNEWSVHYEYSDRTDIDPEVAANYPWRLMRFMDYNHQIMHGRLEDPVEPNLVDQALEIANHPAFAYNALYVGGWWEPDVDPLQPSAPRYAKHNVVAKSMSQIGDSPRVVLFCSASVLAPGSYRKWSDSIPGAHYVVPPIVAGEQLWAAGVVGPGGLLAPQLPTGAVAQATGGQGGSSLEVGEGDASSLRVLSASYDPAPGIPIARYTSQVAIVVADGSVSGETPGDLSDQRRWIYRANSPTYTHP